MNYLGYPQAELEAAGGVWTAREISQQPVVWTKIEDLLSREASALRSFLAPLLQRPDLRIVLTGAGTSSFVGECLVPALKRRRNRSHLYRGEGNKICFGQALLERRRNR